MRRISVFLAIAVVLAPAPVEAAERGTIRGRVVNETTGRPQPGVTVTLTGGGPGMAEVNETGVTDRSGRYSFDELRTGDEIFYALDASYKGGLFAGRPVSLPDDTERAPMIDTTLRVWEPTTDPNAILLRRNDLFAMQRDGILAVIESVRVVNPTNNAYIGRGADMAGEGSEAPTPSLGFALPDDALPETLEWVDADVDVPQVVDIPGLGFGITSAIPPGQLSFTFTYQVEGAGGTFDLSRTAPYAITDLAVFAEPPLEVTGNRLTDDGEVEIEDTMYARSSSTNAIDPADPIQILVVAEGGSSTVLVGGLVAGLIVLALGALWLFRRTKRKRPQVAVRSPRDASPTREDIVTAIAELDVRRENDEIAAAEWARKRAELKARLEEMRGERVR